MPDEIVRETPATGRSGGEVWGSDLIAATLRELDVRYVANVPGSSYRGLHDSIVNHLGNDAPQLILTLHEETAVAIAHGYAKVSGRTMAAALHANIGLLRAPMAIYNAWCDRAPVLLLGSTGPWDATERAPMDWIHTSTDQGGLIRDFTKWDDQPGSPAAAVESLLRAVQIAQTAPRGPVYVNLDAGVQEESIPAGSTPPDVARYAPPPPVWPAPEVVAAAGALLSDATNPVILMGRCSREVEDWDARVALAERLQAPVLTHDRLAAAFPTEHPLHVAPPMLHRPGKEPRALLAAADVVLALDWPDLAGLFDKAYGASASAPPKVIRVSCDAHNHRGWSADHRGLPPADLYLLCETDAAVRALLEVTRERTGSAPPRAAREEPVASDELSFADVATALDRVAGDVDVCFTRLPLAWRGAHVEFSHPLDYIGADGGGGVGSAPGITVGAGLALHGTGRIAVGVMGDGEFLMGNTAVWTAAHYGIGCLFVVANNRSFKTDEEHQQRIARDRGRSDGNQWIGARIDDPDIDIAAMASAQGAVGIGPVTDVDALERALTDGVAAALDGKVCVVDVRVERAPLDPVRKRRARDGAKRVVRGVQTRLGSS